MPASRTAVSAIACTLFVQHSSNTMPPPPFCNSRPRMICLAGIIGIIFIAKYLIQPHYTSEYLGIFIFYFNVEIAICRYNVSMCLHDQLKPGRSAKLLIVLIASILFAELAPRAAGAQALSPLSAAPSPAPTSTASSVTITGSLRAYDFDRLNNTQNAANPNRTAFNAGASLHGDYRIGNGPLSIGATFTVHMHSD